MSNDRTPLRSMVCDIVEVRIAGCGRTVVGRIADDLAFVRVKAISAGLFKHDWSCDHSVGFRAKASVCDCLRRRPAPILEGVSAPMVVRRHFEKTRSLAIRLSARTRSFQCGQILGINSSEFLCIGGSSRVNRLQPTSGYGLVTGNLSPAHRWQTKKYE